MVDRDLLQIGRARGDDFRSEDGAGNVNARFDYLNGDDDLAAILGHRPRARSESGRGSHGSKRRLSSETCGIVLRSCGHPGLRCSPHNPRYRDYR